MTSNQMDPGLMGYDSLLGWKLAANWKGRHRHYDFDVGYSTNAYGFRGEFRLGKSRQGKRYAVVGDSFTFSFGVVDDDTFVALLNRRDQKGNAFLNFGTPGYSTDQEYLLIRDRVFSFSPDVIWLVVYLANDLFDNELAFPLQADHGKPFFELSSDGLALRNTPVPFASKPKSQAEKDLSGMVMETADQDRALLSRIFDRFQLYHLLNMHVSKTRDLSGSFDNRFSSAVRLFNAIIERARNDCRQRGVLLHLILMPGKSYIEKRNSPSAQFQDYLREKIVKYMNGIGIPVFDLADNMRNRYQKRPEKWFFPNEGHLTAEGHRVVADLLELIIHR